MKKVMKTVIAIVCVVAAGIGGYKAYNAANLSQSNLLLVENVEALSAGQENANDPNCYLGGCNAYSEFCSTWESSGWRYCGMTRY